MATLDGFFAHHDVGHNQEIWAPIPGWSHVGNGTFSELNPYVAKFSGQASAYGKSMNISVSIELIDHAPSAPSGACSVNANGQSDGNARYQVVGDALLVTFNGGQVVIKRVEWGRETALEMGGQPPIHLKQV